MLIVYNHNHDQRNDNDFYNDKGKNGKIRTSLYSDMKHRRSNPPIECDIIFTFFPPEDL